MVFGWTPGDMSAFSLWELMEWRERARERFEAANGVQEP